MVNGVGAVTTGIASIIIASTKFTHGAWIVFPPHYYMWS